MSISSVSIPAAQLSEHQRLKMLAPRAGRLRCVLDTDTYNEIDDQFAIVQMLLSPDRFDLKAIYAAPFHNDRCDSPGEGMELSYLEILRLLERLDTAADGLVFRGVTHYVGLEKHPQSAEAVDDLIARARASSPDDPLYVVAIAALSNIASALLLAPDIAGRMVVIWLGGHALDWPDQQEFNLRQDVGAVQVVYDSGVPMVLIPCMGVVSHLHSTIAEIEDQVEPHGEIGRFLAQRFKQYNIDNAVGWSKEVWDMAPVGWLLNPDWAPSILVPTPLMTRDTTYSLDRSRHLMRYVTFVRRDPIFQDLFAKLAAFAR